MRATLADYRLKGSANKFIPWNDQRIRPRLCYLPRLVATSTQTKAWHSARSLERLPLK